jgi:hypothetical protein
MEKSIIRIGWESFLRGFMTGLSTGVLIWWMLKIFID